MQFYDKYRMIFGSSDAVYGATEREGESCER